MFLQLSVMDVLAQTMMKGAVKCDKHCELQNSVNQSNFERLYHFWDMPDCIPAPVSRLFTQFNYSPRLALKSVLGQF